MSKRLTYVDQLKGFAILTVVMGHVLEGFVNANLTGGYTQFCLVLYNLIYSFHMPLFIMLSGITFRTAYASFEGDNIRYKKPRIIRQIKNTLWIYTLWSVVLWAFKMVFDSSTNNVTSIKSLLQIPIVAMPTFWYLYILILFYVFFMFVIHSKKSLLIAAALSVISCLFQTIIMKKLPDITVARFFQYLIFFVIGFLWQDFVVVQIKKVRVYIGCIGVVLLAFYLRQNMYKISGWTSVPLWGGFLAFCICVFLIDMATRFENKIDGRVLCYLGKHSLEIYVMHVIVTAGVRTIAPKVGISFIPIQMLLSFTLGVFAPLFVSWVADKMKMKKMLFKPF